MKIFRSMAGTLLLASLATGVASADDSQWGVGVKAGTLGLGAEARWSGLPYIDFRVGMNAYSVDANGEELGIAYTGEADLDTIYLTANFHFPLSPFRLTAGAFVNGNEVNLVGDETGTYNFGSSPTDWTQDQVGVLSSTTSFASTAPYLGLGFDFEVFGKAGLNFDLGVLYQGDPDVTLESTGTAFTDPILGPEFQAAIEEERLDLENKMDKYRIYPVVSLSFVYNF